MKIELSIEEAKALLNCIYGTHCVANTYPEMPRPEIPVLSDTEVRDNINKMCNQDSITIYINMIRVYSAMKPDFDDILDFLIPYEDEIVSMKSIEGTWYIHTL